MKWKTKDGQILELHEMSDTHLKNAIDYEFRLRGQSNAYFALIEEQQARPHRKFMSQTKVCPWCKNTMRVCEINQEPEVGFSLPKYRFVCQKCGSTSNEIFNKDE